MGRPESALVLGVDGGATRVRVQAATLGSDGLLEALGEPLVASFPTCASFVPESLERQLAQAAGAGPEPGADESELGGARIDALVELLRGRAEAANTCVVRLGVALPGLPTADARGIAVSRNGPRMPRFLDELVARASSAGLTLAPLPARLWSDGEAAVAGEARARGGSLVGIANGLRVGCGTGVAEGVVLNGRVLSTTELWSWCEAPWRLRDANGRVLEDVVSMRGMNAAFVEGGRVEVEAARADDAAQRVLRGAAIALADLVRRRVEEIRAATGVVLERVVLGEHAARLFHDDGLRACFRAPLEERLDLGDEHAPVRVVASELGCAAALGALALGLDSDSGARP